MGRVNQGRHEDVDRRTNRHRPPEDISVSRLRLGKPSGSVPDIYVKFYECPLSGMFEEQ